MADRWRSPYFALGWAKGTMFGYAASLPAVLYLADRNAWSGKWLVALLVLGGCMLVTALMWHLAERDVQAYESLTMTSSVDIVVNHDQRSVTIRRGDAA